jgi:hypothetical protein
MESGTDDERAAAKNLKVWKALLLKEARLDWESAVRLKHIQTPDLILEILDMALNAINVLDFKTGIDQSPYK